MVTNSTIKGPSLRFSNNFGDFRLTNSNFDHTVQVTNNWYLNVRGCNFDFVEPSQESAIKAYDTHLNVEKVGNADLTTFTNCGKGVEFVSSSAQSCRVSDATFHDVLSGVDAKSVAGFLSVNDCTIDLRDTQAGASNFGEGIAIENFIDFEVYNNTIEGGPPSIGATGILISQNGLNDNPNLVVNNEISNVIRGID